MAILSRGFTVTAEMEQIVLEIINILNEPKQKMTLRKGLTASMADFTYIQPQWIY